MSRKPSILVLDDQMLIAFEVASVLEDNGFAVLGPFADVQAAMERLGAEVPDAAILDINMGDGTTSTPLADALLAQELPFAFLTGYGSAGVMPKRFAHIHYMSKPIEADELVSLAMGLIAQRG